ncbi:2-dehydropantoate 2-reductase [Nocardia panacis]|uniref:2-dehydropantoate 2-reductase n=1 Tax=Nocardia panacis TaxID=2340916 RepID=A0A3A4K111_9NOCA|nr:2-dehydropantoate 2-reductase [Nocardia panacis]RJO71013.1 2-dehydropantoate 2-reductase [Nocardia panacis]
MANSPKYTVCVLGPGGIGGLLAALLARAGHRVICLGRPETVRELRAGGIRVRSKQFGEFEARVEADTELREPADLCFITVKQTALSAAVRSLAPEATGDALLVPLLNGVEHPGALRERYRPELVAPGVIRAESTRTAPGRIVHGSAFAEIDLAGAPVVRERLTEWAGVLNDAGLRASVQEDETAMLWRKLFALAPFALMTTYYRAPIGSVRTEHRAELIELLEEVAGICRAVGVAADVDAALRFYDGFPEETMSSMQRDAAAELPLELDAIGGALLRAGEAHAVPAPLTRGLVERVGAASV